jgi:hypothetical protein
MNNVIWLLKALCRALGEVLTGWSNPWFAFERFLGQRLLSEEQALELASKTALRELRIIDTRVRRNPKCVWFGPFTGEVGYELLYWRGFIGACQEQLGLGPDEIGVISRGGVNGWYSKLASNYLDLYSIGGASLVGELQTDLYPIAFDRRHKSLVAVAKGSRRYWIHPRHLHQAIAEFKARPERLEKMQTVVSHLPISKDHLLNASPELLLAWRSIAKSLPRQYLTVKVYTGSNLNNPRHLNHITETLQTLGTQIPLVGLGRTVTTDSHADWTADLKSVAQPMQYVDPSINLGIQSLLIAHSTGFIGTYGGFSYLPLYLQVPTLALKDGGTFQKPAHEVMEKYVAKQLASDYEVIDISQTSVDQAISAFLGRP